MHMDKLAGYTPLLDPRRYAGKIVGSETKEVEALPDGSVEVRLMSVGEASTLCRIYRDAEGTQVSTSGRYTPLSVTPYALRASSFYRVHTDIEVTVSENVGVFFVPDKTFVEAGLSYADVMLRPPYDGPLYVALAPSRKLELARDIVLGRVYFFELFDDSDVERKEVSKSKKKKSVSKKAVEDDDDADVSPEEE